ncbi:MAG: hypothetical protein KAK00_10370 [Nanoarchaeota archaeon]|nr:hypothetical protein [Nanoarchaeota archaeon]
MSLHHTGKNETANSVVKKKWENRTLALNWRNQNKEIIFRLIFYAAHRFAHIFLLCIEIAIP